MFTGHGLMSKLGWNGGGLGSEERPGRTDIIPVVHRVGRSGLTNSQNMSIFNDTMED